MEIIATQQKEGSKSLSKNLIKVDMTPMVDLGFLLITFFMFTSNFSKPHVMDLSYPPKAPIVNDNVIDFKNQITFIIGENNRVFYYQSEVQNLNKNTLHETSFEGNSISKVISSYKKAAPKKENFTIIIKPTEDTNYKNFVDMLDNMAITKSELYGIAEIKDVEKKVYEEKIKY